MIIALILLLPLFASLILTFLKEKDYKLPLITSGLVLATSVYALVMGGDYYLSLPLKGPFVPSFRIDNISSIFIVLTSFIWFVVTIYKDDYMKIEGGLKRFNLSSMMTLLAVLGLFLADDLITMLLFFELMTLASYFWVVHRGDTEAIKAGYFYLFFSIVGGLFIAIGIALLEDHQALSSVLFLLGFGIKSGLFPLHVWLPRAHSNAPSPASALLSGLLIKTGAYGLIRVGEYTSIKLGQFLIVLALITMLVGVLSALIQSDAKKLLAYHSVSQMGYILLGIGLFYTFTGEIASLALMGSLYHIVNHALFKSSLFLAVGIVYMQTKTTNLYDLGALFKRMPFLAIMTAISALGISGVPFFNGYASKTLLHHAMSLAAIGSTPFKVAEILFNIVSVGTVISFVKFYYLIFINRNVSKRTITKVSIKQKISMILLNIVILVIGFMPNLIMNTDIEFFSLHNVLSALITFVIGFVLCIVGFKIGAFHITLPWYLTLEGLVFFIYRFLSATFMFAGLILKKIKSSIDRRFKKMHRKSYEIRKRFKVVKFYGISADAAILVITLLILIAVYVLSRLELPEISLFHFPFIN